GGAPGPRPRRPAGRRADRHLDRTGQHGRGDVAMMQALLTGGGAGLGVALIAYGLHPPRRPLQTVLDMLRRPPAPEPTGRNRAYSLIAAPARRLGLPRERIRLDLATLQKDTAQHLTEQTAATLFGALIIPFAATLLGFHGQIPVWLAVLGGAF